MIIATHQPTFLPWPGLFAKVVMVDSLVLLDDVQFPRGRSWVNRNRLKNEQGEFWLTVPVHKKNRGLQRIRDVELFNETQWRKKQLRGVRQSYANAPYLDDFFPALERIYGSNHRRLISLNYELIDYLRESLELEGRLVLQSDLGITGQATELIARICEELGASHYLTFAMSLKHLDQAVLDRAGIKIIAPACRSLIYPQLWGGFLPNLSTLDLVLNCGPKGGSLLRASTCSPG